MIKLFFITMLTVNLFLMSFCSLGYAKAKGTILFVPHDNRPTSCEQSAEAPELLGYNVLMPPKEMLGGLHTKGDIDALWDWVNNNSKEADAAVISTDTLIYGGLVASRKHDYTDKELRQRTERIKSIKKTNPKMKLYTFSSLMRTPKNGAAAGVEEPDYYQVHGENIFKASALVDKSEIRKLSREEAKALGGYRNSIPQKIWNDYFDRRKRNITVTKRLMDYVSEGAIDYMVVGKDDNAPYCATHQEARQLTKYARKLKQDQFMLSTGIDEYSMLLLTRAVNKLENKQYKVNVQYNVGMGGETVPAFSDVRIHDSIMAELAMAGAKEEASPDAADLVLLVNTDPNGRTQDGRPDPGDADPMYNDGNPRLGTWEFLRIVKENLATNRKVSLADVAFANGSDNALMHMLQKNHLLFRLRSYSGWNTATNSTGFALGQGLLSLGLNQNQCNQMLVKRYLDDWGYQANIREKLAQTFPSSKYYFDLAEYEPTAIEFTQKGLQDFARNNLSEYPGLDKLTVNFPWHIPFIGGINVPANTFINDKIALHGRWAVEMNQATCGQGAAYIRAKFKGPKIGVKMDDKNCWWRYSIDGTQFDRIKFTDDVTVLATDLGSGEHKITLVRSTEGEAGLSIFKGFVFDKEDDLLELVEPERLQLEFVGDSILAGGFNEKYIYSGTYYDMEDNDMSFGPQLARMLGADYSVLGKSGEGVVHNYGETWPSHEVHTADRYPWTCYSFNGEVEHPVWDFANHPSDAVIISIGTNDFTDPNRKPEEQDFIDGYKRLVQVVRKYNPQTPIICVEALPTMIGPRAGRWTAAAVKELQRQGDKALYYIPLNKDKPLMDDEDYVGDGTHPSKEGSKKIALFLLDKVKNILAEHGKL